MPPSGLPLRVQWQLDGITFNGPPDQLGREWVIDTETGWSASPPLPSDSATGLDFGTSDTTGLDFNAGNGLGLDFGPQASTGRATVTNGGTADTAPRFTLTGPLQAPITITRPDNGARIIYLDNLDP